MIIVEVYHTRLFAQRAARKPRIQIDTHEAVRGNCDQKLYGHSPFKNCSEGTNFGQSARPSCKGCFGGVGAGKKWRAGFALQHPAFSFGQAVARLPTSSSQEAGNLAVTPRCKIACKGGRGPEGG